MLRERQRALRSIGRAARLGAFVCVATLAACRDSTGSSRSIVVTIRSASTSAPVITESPDGPTITCSVELIATARGSGSALWDDAVFTWSIGAGVETEALDASEVQYSWGVSEIAVGAEQSARWQFSASAPFTIEADFGYVPAGTRKLLHATTTFSCGAVPPTGGTSPPVVSQLALPSLDGEVQRGDTIVVSYAASSSQGLWATGVVISGGFDARRTFTERMAPSVQRTVKFAVPPAARLGVPVVVSAFAVDPALEQSTRQLVTRIVVVDRVPPTLSKLSLSGPPLYRVSGQFAVGDMLPLIVTADDNNALDWLVYEVDSPANTRDSVRVPTDRDGPNWGVNVPVRSEWIGSPRVSVHVRDAGGLTSPALSLPTDSLRFYPTVARQTSTTVSLPGPSVFPVMGDIVYDARRDRMYIAQPSDSRIAVLTPGTMSFDTPISLPSQPAGLDLSVSGDSLLVAMPALKSLGVINLAQPSTPPGLIEIPLLDTAGTEHPAVTPRPVGLRIAANGVVLVMLSHGTRSGDQTLEVNLGTGGQRLRTDARGTRGVDVTWLENIGRPPDRSRIVLLTPNCPRTYLASTDAFTPCAQAPGTNTTGLTFDTAGTRVTVGSYVLDWRLEPVRQGLSNTMALSADGEFVYMRTDQSLGTSESVRKMLVADGTLVERFLVPTFAERLFVSPAGDWMLVFQLSYGARITRVDLR